MCDQKQVKCPKLLIIFYFKREDFLEALTVTTFRQITSIVHSRKTNKV